MTVKRLREAIPPTEIEFDSENANIGTERGERMIGESLETVGPGRAPVIDAAGRVIAGNKILQAAIERGIPIDIIETYGEAMLVHQRKDLDLTDPKGKARRMAYLDNRTSEVSLAWDVKQIEKSHQAGMDMTEMFFPSELAKLGADIQTEFGMDFISKGKGGSNTLMPDADDRMIETHKGQTWILGGHRLTLGTGLRPGDAEVMILAWERFTGYTAELAEDDDSE